MQSLTWEQICCEASASSLSGRRTEHGEPSSVGSRGEFSCQAIIRCKGESQQSRLSTGAPKSSIQRFVITEKAPTRAFSWLKAPTSAFTFKTLIRHYAKQALTPRSLNMKLGPWCNYHKGRAAIRHYANQPARPLWPLHRGPNFTLRDRGVNACLA